MPEPFLGPTRSLPHWPTQPSDSRLLSPGPGACASRGDPVRPRLVMGRRLLSGHGLVGDGRVAVVRRQALQPSVRRAECGPLLAELALAPQTPAGLGVLRSLPGGAHASWFHRLCWGRSLGGRQPSLSERRHLSARHPKCTGDPVKVGTALPGLLSQLLRGQTPRGWGRAGRRSRPQPLVPLEPLAAALRPPA